MKMKCHIVGNVCNNKDESEFHKNYLAQNHHVKRKLYIELKQKKTSK